MKMFVDGRWREGAQSIEVCNPYDGSTIDTVPRAGPADLDATLRGAVQGAAVMAQTTGYDRYLMLRTAAQEMVRQQEDLARTISREAGKTLAEARVEVSRAVQTIELSSEEAKRLGGEVLPLDGAPGVGNRLGLTLRVPCGVVVAITPFNFPLNLVCHKVGPALAAGNSVVVKPASDTPLIALRLVEILLESGIPPLAVACITGSGAEIGKALCSDPRVRKVSFTGSRDVGAQICRAAGLKKVTMELGSNSPLVIMEDADLDKVAQATVASGYANAGQVCISAQRILVMDKVYEDYLQALRPRVEEINVGDPLDESNRMGPMIRQRDAERVEQWVGEAVGSGARLLCGHQRDGAIYHPTVLADVDPSARVSRDELFGPAVAVSRVSDIQQAVRLANDTNYGLSAAVFTQNIDHALTFAREVQSGNIHVNWGTVWRADLMPYGGLKESGMGKEGPKYAVEEMTETKTIVFH